MKVSGLTVNADAIEDGARITDIPECGDLVIITKGLGNAAYNRLQQKKIAALPRHLRRTGRIDPELMEQIATACLIETCLLGWENFTDDEGAPIPFSKEAAKMMLTDPRFRPLRDACMWAAVQVGDERAADQEDAAGNSPTA